MTDTEVARAVKTIDESHDLLLMLATDLQARSRLDEGKAWQSYSIDTLCRKPAGSVASSMRSEELAQAQKHRLRRLHLFTAYNTPLVADRSREPAAGTCMRSVLKVEMPEIHTPSKAARPILGGRRAHAPAA